MTRINPLTMLCLLLLGCVLATPAHATTNCAYTFTSGSSNSYLSYCVTVNGNILRIVTPFNNPQSGPEGEGYGICDATPQQNYTDYGVGDTGNWGAAILLSKTTGSVRIARTTSDGNWTLTQTITRVPKEPSITVVMALKNNQSTAREVYLVRYADAQPASGVSTGIVYRASLNGSFASPSFAQTAFSDGYLPGLQLANEGNSQFGFWQGFIQGVESGPSPCAFAGETFAQYMSTPGNFGSIEYAYAGTVPAGGTKMVTLSYRGL